jgi:hypothetical protein
MSKDKNMLVLFLPKLHTELGTIKTLIYQLTAMELQGKCWWHNVLQEKYRELIATDFGL